MSEAHNGFERIRAFSFFFFFASFLLLLVLPGRLRLESVAAGGARQVGVKRARGSGRGRPTLRQLRLLHDCFADTAVLLRIRWVPGTVPTSASCKASGCCVVVDVCCRRANLPVERALRSICMYVCMTPAPAVLVGACSREWQQTVVVVVVVAR